MKYGNDISRHQSTDAIEQLHRGGKAEFVILRSSFGTYTEDDKFERYLKDSERLGFKNSIYHAAYAGTVAEAVEEADFCLDTLEKYSLSAKDIELPVFYDYEYFSADYNKGRGIATTPQLVQEITTAFCERVKERGYKAGVYFNKDYLDRFYTKEYFKAHPDYWRWYARPGYAQPDYDCELWQYGSDNGAEYGYNGNIDKNVLYAEYFNIDVKVMKPLSEQPVRMYMGYASDGDVKALVTLINGLGIGTTVKDGYITTDIAVSKGDQCYILSECNRLVIPCSIYEEKVEETSECEQLKAEIAELEKQLVIEQQYKDAYWQDVQRLTAELEKVETDEVLKAQLETANNKLLSTTAELLAANKALSASRESLDSLTAENATLKSTISKVKEILQ